MSKPEHGGNLDEAMARYGGARADWLDLSTGINPVAWPVPPVSQTAWTRLPGSGVMERLLQAARACYGVAGGNAIVAAAGAQALIQMMPHIVPQGSVRILSPTYNEYSASFGNYGCFSVSNVPEVRELHGADVAVLINPNNPDGRRHDLADLQSLANQVGCLIVDEAFADASPELSLCPLTLPENVIVLRSFGKFFGLAGLRLGFAVVHSDQTAKLQSHLGPWAVSGPAIEIGTAALSDSAWIASSAERLSNDMNILMKLFDRLNLEVVGGCDLFATVRVEDAAGLRDRLAAQRIWVRVFDYEPTWLRFGLPGDKTGLERLTQALEQG